MDLRKLLIIIISLSLLACSAPKSNKKVSAKPVDYKIVDIDKYKPAAKKLPPPPPALKKPTVKKINPLEGKFVTINAINEPVSRVLFMIAADTGLNLVISPSVDKDNKVTLTLQNAPAEEALNIVMETTGLLYELDGSIIRIKKYLSKKFIIPYIKNTSEYKSKLGGDIVGNATEDNKGLKGDFSLEYKNSANRNDLYAIIAKDLQAILFPTVMDSKGQTGNESGQDKKNPSDGGKADVELKNGSYQAGMGDMRGFTLNIFTGTLIVRASKTKMELVDEYIKEVLKNIGKQVLIEARIIEVILDDAFSYGINWSQSINQSRGTFNQIFSTRSSANLASSALLPVATFADSTRGYSLLMSFLEKHGTLETLGKPRIRVVNGQSAIISSGSLIPYWERTVEEQDNNGITEKTITYDRTTVLDGIILGVTPYIHDDGKITLNIVPVSSSIQSEKTIYDENNALAASFPIVNLKEAGTVIKVIDGETIIMGGLINNKQSETEEKIPLLGDIPGIGALFKSKTIINQKRELVIMLTTRIINK